jgi:hypothetical protein
VAADLEGEGFEWEEEKAEANIANHGVDFFEAVTVFGDPLSLIYDDDEHSNDERRFLTVGTSIQNRTPIVSYTERGDRIQIISARKATPKEIRDYEEAN